MEPLMLVVLYEKALKVGVVGWDLRVVEVGVAYL